MRSSVQTVAALLCFLSALANRALADTDLTVDQVLERHQTSLKRLKQCTLTTQERWMIAYADGGPEQLLSTRKCDIRIDGPRVNLLVFEVNFPAGVVPPEDESKGNANEFNYVCDDHVLEIFYPHEVFSVRPAAPQGINGRLTPQKVDEFFIQNIIGNAAIAFGLTPFAGAIPVTDLIPVAKENRGVMDEFGYRVEGTAPDGTRHKIWFDPDASFVIRKLALERSGETLSDNRFQYNRRVLTSRYRFSEKAVVDSVVVELQCSDIQPWKDTHVIQALEATKTITAADGSRAIERTIHTLTNWNLEPDFSDPASFRPQLPIPEGARVLVRDTASLEYKYADGKIQLAINEKTVQSLEQVKVSRSAGPPKTQWVWAIVAALLGIAWWRLRAAAN